MYNVAVHQNFDKSCVKQDSKPLPISYNKIGKRSMIMRSRKGELTPSLVKSNFHTGKEKTAQSNLLCLYQQRVQNEQSHNGTP